MNPETQASLLALEKELERLRSAVEHIEQAKGVAQKVISAVAVIQKKYAEHLDALLDVQKDTLREVSSMQHERFDELGAGARKHILEAAARAKKYIEEYNTEVGKAIDAAGEQAEGTVRDVALKAGGMIQTAGARMEELSSKADEIIDASGKRIEGLLSTAGREVEEHISGAGERLHADVTEAMTQAREQLQELLERVRGQIGALNETAARILGENGTAAGKHIEDLAGKTASALEQIDTRARRHVEEVGTQARANLNEVLLQAKAGIEDAGNQSKRIFAAIKKAQDQQLTEFEKVTVSADALIATSGKLVRTIDAIDFPTRLQSIESDIRSLHYNLNSAMSRLDALGKSNEQAMAAFSEEVVGKLGRLEMFTEKTVRTHGEDVEKRLKEQERQLGGMRMLLIVLLLLQVLVGAGVYLVWDAGRQPAAPVEQVIDTTATPDDVVAPQ
ncbi:MAG: hypothetical protein KFH87_07295 [Bacteroidetes bacterium]|nr:hypothetical protein [Bacteroidota bacterium]